jgi:hypothetical protein
MGGDQSHQRGRYTVLISSLGRGVAIKEREIFSLLAPLVCLGGVEFWFPLFFGLEPVCLVI